MDTHTAEVTSVVRLLCWDSALVPTEAREILSIKDIPELNDEELFA